MSVEDRRGRIPRSTDFYDPGINHHYSFGSAYGRATNDIFPTAGEAESARAALLEELDPNSFEYKQIAGHGIQELLPGQKYTVFKYKVEHKGKLKLVDRKTRFHGIRPDDHPIIDYKQSPETEVHFPPYDGLPH